MSDFPPNPVYNQQWTDPVNNVTYRWTGDVWISAGQGISIEPTIYTFYDDNPAIGPGDRTSAINAILIANNNISDPSEIKSGYQVLCFDGPGPSVNANVPPGGYISDGSIWHLRPTSTAPVTSVFGRIGNVASARGDYALSQLSDVSPTPPTTNNVLRFDGTNWVPSVNLVSLTVTSPIVNMGTPSTPIIGFSISSLPTLP